MDTDAPELKIKDIGKVLASLPTTPGVYMMKAAGKMLYIGKAKNLRSRVRSYFKGRGDGRYAVRFLASRTEEIETIVTTNEKEALILEDTLLKKHRPRYNIRLKDDKTYVSIKITMAEKFPRILVTRKIVKDGSRYFGPYASAGAVRDTVKFIRRIFPLCVCTPHEFRNRVRPCLDHQLGICAAHAVGLISEEDYKELVEGTVMFLEGRNRELIKKLKREMSGAATDEDFEEAAKLRDRIDNLESTLEEQSVVSTLGRDSDVFAMVRGGDHIVVQGHFIRDGRLTGAASYPFNDTGLPDLEVMSSFISQFYRRGERHIPDEIFSAVSLEDSSVIGDWLTGRKGKRVSVVTPKRGRKVRLVRMAIENAAEALRRKIEAEKGKGAEIEEVRKKLKLKSLPRTIEAFDMSNISGTSAVGAMVVFTDGVPDKSRYRKYKIKTVDGSDDYAMMKEVMTRRYEKGSAEMPDLILPDLILLDGGKGQLSAAVEVMKELGIKGQALAAIAKERDSDGVVRRGRALIKGESVYLPGRKNPVVLKEGTRGEHLLMAIRDEVHRFAIGYHRKVRAAAIGSVIDKVPGIGPKKRVALFEKFKDLPGIAGATVKELTTVPGITEETAKRIKEALDG